jgi:signal transduction histidine kinase
MLSLSVLVAWHYSAQLVITVVVAALLSGFHRTFQRPYLRHWALSWWAFAAYRGAVALGVELTQLPRHDPLRLASALVLALASSAQVVSLLQGTWEVTRGRASGDAPPRRPLSAFVALSAFQGLAFLAGPGGDPSSTLVSSLGRMLVVGGTALTAAAWIWRADVGDPINRRLLPSALVLWASSSLGVVAAVVLGRTHAEPVVASLIFVDLVVQGLLAIATVSWLLGEERTREREHARLQADARRNETMAVLGNLVGGVAHEVRNPLFAISSTVDALGVRLAERPDVAPYLVSLRSEVARLNTLMQDLLDYGRPSTQRIGRAALSQVVAEAVQATKALADERHVVVEAQLDGGLPALLMDRRRMAQVFRNLIDNAIRHSPEGGAVRLSARPLRREGGDWVACSVEDEGDGFPAGDETKAFEPFFTRRRGGTGLGLSIVQRILEQHGGSVEACNRASGGARLTVVLPVEPS